jgi:ATP-dependent RNA helicase RhlE
MTGSGKTAAFLLPMLDALLSRPRGTTRALVVVPTRELAAQILEHLRGLAGSTGIRGAAIYGGVAMGPQTQAFRTGADVLVATPGRLLDHLQYRYADLTRIEWLVLDEADRMLEMGFLPDVRRILQRLPAERRTLLFSATLPAAIRDLAMQMLRDPVRLTVGRASAPATGIAHRVYPVPHDLKSHLLLSLLGEAPAKSVLAFTRTKHRANRLADFLEARGVACARIHGNRSQAQRTEAMAGFKRGRFRVLVATDIAARGIDVEALGLVVNFDVPHVPEDYVHRVGRTARASATGDACTFVSPEEEGDLRAIERHLGSALPRHRVAGFDYTRLPAERLELSVAERLRRPRSRRGDAPRTSPARTAATSRRGGAGAGMAWLRSVTTERGAAPHARPRGRERFA